MDAEYHDLEKFVSDVKLNTEVKFHNDGELHRGILIGLIHEEEHITLYLLPNRKIEMHYTDVGIVDYESQPRPGEFYSIP